MFFKGTVTLLKKFRIPTFFQLSIHIEVELHFNIKLKSESRKVINIVDLFLESN